jgi:hypothetical protein
MNVTEYEARVREVEGIWIVIRAPREAKIEGPGYHFEKAIGGKTTVSSWVRTRIKGTCPFEVVIISPDESVPLNPRTHVKSLRIPEVMKR